MIVEGTHESYFWLVSTTGDFDELLRNCPAILVDRYVAVTAIDSGPLTPSEEERAAGWSVEGGIAYSPRLASAAVVPFAGWDEWYVFSEPMRLGQVDVFVNYGGFTLENPRPALAQDGESSDDPGHNDLLSKRRQLRQRFWDQIQAIHPETYLAEGDFLIMATENRRLFDSVLLSLL